MRAEEAMNVKSRYVFVALATWLPISTARSQTTAFTYQGRLQSAGAAANGLHDLRFRLFDAATGGAQVGATLCVNDVTVSGGLLTATLDFGAQFNGSPRFLEVE